MENPVQKWLLTMLKRIFGVRDTTTSWLCESVALSPYSTLAVQLFSCHNASLQFSDPMQQHYCQTSFTCWRATELQVWWLLVFQYFFSHDWSGTRIHVQRKAAELWTRWFQSFCCGPQQRERHLEFWTPYSDGPREHNSKILNYTDGVHCPPKRPWLLVLLTAFPNTYS